MRGASEIRVRVRIAGLIDGHPLNAASTVELRHGATVKDLFKSADKAPAFNARRPFRRLFRQGIIPVILVNGDRLELPGDLSRRLGDGDQVSVILAVAGG
jgi:molybdopterin converting factor small subunit